MGRGLDDGQLGPDADAPGLVRDLEQRLRAAGQVAWRGVTFFFKIWIVVTLIAYVIAFIAMMISLMFAKSNDRNDRRGGGGDMFWIWYLLMPDLAPRGYGRQLQRPDDNRPKKRFYISVFDFVFGPKGKPLDPHESDKRMLAFLRDHKGRIPTSELVALTGLSLDAADEELTRLTVEYDGEVEVAEDGTLIYVFAGIMTSAETAGTWWTWAWDKHEPQPALTGNTAGTNAAIAGFSGFNLLASLTVGPAFLHRIHLSGDPIATFFVTVFPLLFSMVFFAIPGGRYLVAKRRDKKRLKLELRRELLREIWTRPDDKFDPEALAKTAAERAKQPLETSKRALEVLLAELEGDVETDAEGRLRYTFPRITVEKKAIAASRAAAPVLELGKVVFSSEDEQPAS